MNDGDDEIVGLGGRSSSSTQDDLEEPLLAAPESTTNYAEPVGSDGSDDHSNNDEDDNENDAENHGRWSSWWWWWWCFRFRQVFCDTPFFPDDPNKILIWLRFIDDQNDEQEEEEEEEEERQQQEEEDSNDVGRRDNIGDDERVNNTTGNNDNNDSKPVSYCYRIVVMKLVKFLVLTWFWIGVVHTIIKKDDDRDTFLTMYDLWLYEGDQILRDCFVFFVIGRLWETKSCGVDNLLWTTMILTANMYFQSQHYVKWLQHSVTLYEMHCIWPWQLWVFVIVMIPLFTTIFLAHVIVAYGRSILKQKLFEFVMCIGLFVAPNISSPYFHFHHWFAGWIFGMHANLSDLWWSKATMAYFWGMYINGIAVYGRDPLLTCDYAKFMVQDQRCHFQFDNTEEDDSSTVLSHSLLTVIDGCYGYNQRNEIEIEDENGAEISIMAMILQIISSTTGVSIGDDSHPADWRNCSSHGYHP